MTTNDFDKIWLDLTQRQRGLMMESLKQQLSAEDYKVLAVHLSLLELFNNPKKYKALGDAMAEAIYRDFTE